MDFSGWISCSEEKFDAGPFSFWFLVFLHGKFSARLVAIPGSRLTGLAQLSCTREVDFCFV